MTTGQLIKRERKRAKLTQKELGQKLGLSFQAIAQWENDLRKPKRETLKKIAVALGMESWEYTKLIGMDAGEEDSIIDNIISNAIATGKVDELPEELKARMIIQGMRVKLSNADNFPKLSDAEAHNAGFLQFKSEEDRIAYFYGKLNTDGKLIASKCFYQHLDKDSIAEVADYVEKLSEIPQYQRTDAPQSPQTLTDGKEDTAPQEPPPETPQDPPEGE